MKSESREVIYPRVLHECSIRIQIILSERARSSNRICVFFLLSSFLRVSVSFPPSISDNFFGYMSDTSIGTGIGIYPMYPKFKWRSDTIEMHFGYDSILLIVQMSHLNDQRSRLREMTHRIDKLGHWLESDLIGRFQTLFRESVKFCVCSRFASVLTRIGISRLHNYYFHTNVGKINGTRSK